MIIAYLGKRGGGEDLLHATLDELFYRESAFDLNVINAGVSPVEKIPHKVKIYKVSLPHNRYELFKPKTIISIFKYFLTIIYVVSIDKEKMLLQLMPSPFDVFLDLVAKINKVTIVRCIHETYPHAGEKYPRISSIKLRLATADHILVFSNFVYSKVLEMSNKSVLKIDLPVKIDKRPNVLGIIDDIRIKSALKNKVPIYLCIGRIRKYKGIDLLIDAINSIELNAVFIIAGEGKIHSVPSNPNLVIINKWLSKHEFNELIEISSALVLPYTEASQSGIIPIAIANSKMIVSTGFGGFREQFEGYQRHFLIENLTKDGIGHALLKSSENMKKSIKPNGDVTKENKTTLVALVGGLMSEGT